MQCASVHTSRLHHRCVSHDVIVHTRARTQDKNTLTLCIFTCGLCRLADRGPSIWGGGPAVRCSYDGPAGRTDKTRSLATASRRSGGGGGVCIGNEVLHRELRVVYVHSATIILLYTCDEGIIYISIYIYIYTHIKLHIYIYIYTGSVSCADLRYCVAGASARRFCLIDLSPPR